MDTSEYARFQRPDHRLTGDSRSQDRWHRDGIDLAHAIVDDHARLACAQIHVDEYQGRQTHPRLGAPGGMLLRHRDGRNLRHARQVGRQRPSGDA
jgi:hypothetical protein